MADSETATRAIDEATVRAMFARFGDRAAFFADPDAIWTERPHYHVMVQNVELHGREEVVSWFRGLFDAVPDLRMDVEDVAVSGNPGRERVTVRWRLTGTFTGAPYLGIEPTGRSLDLRGMDLIDFEDGRVAGNHIYYDQLIFMRQIGMLPPKDSPGSRLITNAFNAVTKGRAAIRQRAQR